jgi:hypothetical protein
VQRRAALLKPHRLLSDGKTRISGTAQVSQLTQKMLD